MYRHTYQQASDIKWNQINSTNQLTHCDWTRSKGVSATRHMIIYLTLVSIKIYVYKRIDLATFFLHRFFFLPIPMIHKLSIFQWGNKFYSSIRSAEKDNNKSTIMTTTSKEKIISKGNIMLKRKRKKEWFSSCFIYANLEKPQKINEFYQKKKKKEKKTHNIYIYC